MSHPRRAHSPSTRALWIQILSRQCHRQVLLSLGKSIKANTIAYHCAGKTVLHLLYLCSDDDIETSKYLFQNLKRF